jgi:D-glycero-D-manno-heptose 1,7-bisphosphate phosphatase
MTPAVFLDRDGVLVREIVDEAGVARAPVRVADFHILEDAAALVHRLKTAGFRCVVFTNQPEVARGLLPLLALDEMHRQLRQVTLVDDIRVCPHDDPDNCLCRKPKPGMLLAAARDADIDLSRSYVVGDRWRDIGAGRAVGCYSILIDRPYSQCDSADARVADLAGAVDVIVVRHGATANGLH